MKNCKDQLPFVPPTYCRGRANTKRNLWYPRIVSELKACEVSYRGYLGVKHSVEVTAQSLYEAAALGSKLLKVSSLDHVTFEVRIREPEKKLEVSGAVLAAWLARPGRNPKQQVLKARLHEIMQSGSS